jgi:hypothetical protein
MTYRFTGLVASWLCALRFLARQHLNDVRQRRQPPPSPWEMVPLGPASGPPTGGALFEASKRDRGKPRGSPLPHHRTYGSVYGGSLD